MLCGVQVPVFVWLKLDFLSFHTTVKRIFRGCWQLALSVRKAVMIRDI